MCLHKAKRIWDDSLPDEACRKELEQFMGGERRSGRDVKSSNLRMKMEEFIRNMLDSSRRKVGT